ncbi:hypothetical protein RMN57_08195 [Kitasatospora sp. CM 4170]|uniref:Uncharacterized protein n=1 Tax=Kitasatospora aburaviensis TaxID=67265 RepID=A0ABW1ETM5_9ACTN|nr:hypothetical protein [Kitasatospora sp. CM 4170]WNM44697.1 hypothetical protein RMN57_08195 [Kitasatospora sp. CM 4170]
MTTTAPEAGPGVLAADAVDPTGTTDPTGRLAALLIAFLETGTPPDGLFRPGVFCDLTVPQWRLQARGVPGLVALRRGGHPAPGAVPRHRLDRTGSGFVLEVEESWEQDGQRWYCRELLRADVRDGAVDRLSVYCTGDWDAEQQRRHRAEVTLLEP